MVNTQPTSQEINPQEPTWQQVVARYQQPDLRRSLWQLANTIIPYLVLYALMVYSL